MATAAAQLPASTKTALHKDFQFGSQSNAFICKAPTRVKYKLSLGEPYTADVFVLDAMLFSKLQLYLITALL
ncbi:hypothetical protein ColLi_09449 [Colletotrichum liriopes]|uniref:Uncharacterized protein n=1 Tax=Colletotrichum liriopes TaxID=708192 RepID=A0AA37GST8_9PEZI|nr:hypothetical protein ColLi_09449 [Colletotrichum liriopes]